jgi:hypothetical protein
MEGDKRNIIDDIKKVTISEDLIYDAIRDIYKEEIKSIIMEKVNKDPRMKKEFRESLEEFVRAKLIEGTAIAKMTKILVEVAVVSLPQEMKEELVNSIIKAVGPEIDELLKKTL